MLSFIIKCHVEVLDYINYDIIRIFYNNEVFYLDTNFYQMYIINQFNNYRLI